MRRLRRTVVSALFTLGLAGATLAPVLADDPPRPVRPDGPKPDGPRPDGPKPDGPKPDRPPKDTPAPAEVTRRLENGVVAIVLPSARAKSVSVLVAHRAGARDESKAESGAARLVARLVRRAACGKRAAGVAEGELAALGPTTGEALHELTYWQAQVPEAQLGLALEIAADRQGALKPTAEDLEVERASALAEPVRREARTWNALLSATHGDTSLGRSRLGDPAVVGAIGLDALEAWRKAHLRTDNLVVVIAGVHDANAALERIAATLGKLPRSEGEAKAPEPAGSLAAGPARTTLEAPTTARLFLEGFRGPEPGGAEEAAFLALAFHAKDRLGVALKSATSEIVVRADARSAAPALLVVRVTPRPSVSIADVESRVAAGIAAARSEPGDPRALALRVKRLLEALTAPLDLDLRGAKDEPAALAEAALGRALAQPLVERRGALEKHLETLDAQGLAAAAATYLAPERARAVVCDVRAP